MLRNPRMIVDCYNPPLEPDQVDQDPDHSDQPDPDPTRSSDLNALPWIEEAFGRLYSSERRQLRLIHQPQWDV